MSAGAGLYQSPAPSKGIVHGFTDVLVRMIIHREPHVPVCRPLDYRILEDRTRVAMRGVAVHQIDGERDDRNKENPAALPESSRVSSYRPGVCGVLTPPTP